MLNTILTIIGFVLVSVLVVSLIRFVLFLQKVIGNINNQINTITDELKDIKKDISNALAGIEKFLENAVQTIDKTNDVVAQMKNVTDTIFAPIRGVKRITSTIGNFFSAVRNKNKLMLNTKISEENIEDLK